MTFKSGPFPSTEEVLRHFYDSWSNSAFIKDYKKDESIEYETISILGQQGNQTASTANALLGHWAPSYLPFTIKRNAKEKVLQFYKSF